MTTLILIDLNSGTTLQFPSIKICQGELPHYLSPTIQVSGFRCSNEADFGPLQDYIHNLTNHSR